MDWPSLDYATEKFGVDDTSMARCAVNKVQCKIKLLGFNELSITLWCSVNFLKLICDVLQFGWSVFLICKILVSYFAARLPCLYTHIVLVAAEC